MPDIAEETDHEVDPDAQALLAVASGDTRAMRAIVERWQKPLINYFYRSTKSRHEAEDLAQQVFVNLYKAAPRYEPRAKFSTFVFHIARRQLMNNWRTKKRKPLDAVDPEHFQHEPDHTQPYESTAEIEEALGIALEQLPEKQRTALLLLKQQELSYEEIAHSMEATVSLVKSWIHRGRKALKQAMEELT